jgi:hypothetical protein
MDIRIPSCGLTSIHSLTVLGTGLRFITRQSSCQPYMLSAFLLYIWLNCRTRASCRAFFSSVPSTCFLEVRELRHRLVRITILEPRETGEVGRDERVLDGLLLWCLTSLCHIDEPKPILAEEGHGRTSADWSVFASPTPLSVPFNEARPRQSAITAFRKPLTLLLSEGGYLLVLAMYRSKDGRFGAQVTMHPVHPASTTSHKVKFRELTCWNKGSDTTSKEHVHSLACLHDVMSAGMGQTSRV